MHLACLQVAAEFLEILIAPALHTIQFSENPLKYLRQIHYSFTFVHFYYKSIYYAIAILYFEMNVSHRI